MSEVRVNSSACCDRSGRAAFTVPAIKLPALCRATPFRARALRRCGGCLLLSLVPYHPFESIRLG
ncbi:hypothetical protein AB7B85_29005 [Klebsiella pneumoniae]|uniref:Single-stranded DNA-binding protein n=1 Tax=Klebsiella pneumoniae TaxID=573 RepID=A0A927HKK8_KLEPN|nr:hypothetical protein [Klebsiella pneumoniae]MBD3705146.1 hypothetical protein [Klebsiella pneumoniae]